MDFSILYDNYETTLSSLVKKEESSILKSVCNDAKFEEYKELVNKIIEEQLWVVLFELDNIDTKFHTQIKKVLATISISIYRETLNAVRKPLVH